MFTPCSFVSPKQAVFKSLIFNALSNVPKTDCSALFCDFLKIIVALLAIFQNINDRRCHYCVILNKFDFIHARLER